MLLPFRVSPSPFLHLMSLLSFYLPSHLPCRLFGDTGYFSSTPIVWVGLVGVVCSFFLRFSIGLDLFWKSTSCLQQDVLTVEKVTKEEEEIIFMCE